MLGTIRVSKKVLEAPMDVHISVIADNEDELAIAKTVAKVLHLTPSCYRAKDGRWHFYLDGSMTAESLGRFVTAISK